MPAGPNVNQVVLVGQLCRDPELRELPDGRPVCDLRLAVNDRRGDRDSLFIDVAAFGREAETCAEYLKKGKQIAVTGRLVYREWETRSKEKRSKHQLVAHRVDFGASEKDGQES